MNARLQVSAPFTANVWEIRVEAGQAVKAGDTLVVLEAMKMESPVHAPVAGELFGGLWYCLPTWVECAAGLGVQAL